MDEIISYKPCAVKVHNAKLRNYLNYHLFSGEILNPKFVVPFRVFLVIRTIDIYSFFKFN
jgi:hypothetical protein